MVAKADNDPKPTDQDRPTMDNKKSVLSCGQNALNDFPSARLSLARLYPHRALFRLTVREALEQSEGKKRMIFRAYASENLGVWGGPQGALRAQPQNNGNRKFTIFAILLLPNIKSVVDPRYHSLTEHAILHRSCGSFANCVATAFVPTHCAIFRILQSSILTPASARISAEILVRLSQIDPFGLVPKMRRFGNQKMVPPGLPNSLKTLP